MHGVSSFMTKECRQCPHEHATPRLEIVWTELSQTTGDGSQNCHRTVPNSHKIGSERFGIVRISALVQEPPKAFVFQLAAQKSPVSVAFLLDAHPADRAGDHQLLNL
jgi:hypothetical protein